MIKKKPKKPSRKLLVKKLDTIFSEYVRRKDADLNGIVKCYTCEKRAYWKGQGMQNGHFISRASRILRWSVDNCRPQCYACNCMRYGQNYIFAMNLNEEFGYDIASELLIKSRETIKQADFELIELYEKYKLLVEKL
mgnify:CR=1 FL=1|tara:strand:- start:701 stop:1111 length:411 start_codon:yes stop_codon:yes gene_type:complete